MSFDWSEYLSLAQELSGMEVAVPAGVEARQRVVISRAYYAAFCVAREYWLAQGRAIPRNGRAHVSVRTEFSSSRDPRCRQLERKLKNLHENRKSADYENRLAGLTQMTEASLFLSAEIITQVRSLPC